jgi:DUF4097 and DUF4098 domain-containing protein YvlB
VELLRRKKPTVIGGTQGDGVGIVTKCPGGLLGTRCSVDYVITVPQTAKVKLHTGNGSVHVTGIDGDASIDTGDGRITLEGVSGALVTRTGNGSIRGSQLKSTSFEARTGDGSIQVDWATEPSQVHATTGNGSIRLALPPGSGPYRTSTHAGNGKVTVDVPTDPGAKASLTAKTGDGSIRISTSDVR